MALINSIRLVDTLAPIVVVDAGLDREQVALVAREAFVLNPPPGLPLFALRPVGPLACPARVAVLLDADVIVTCDTASLLDLARTGRVVAFLDNEPHASRFFPEWHDALDLPPVRSQAYCNAGQLVVPESRWAILGQWQSALTKVDSNRTWLESRDLAYPFYFGDQDVFNAIAASHLSVDEIALLEHRLAPHPPFTGLALVDEQRVICSYPDGIKPHFIHHTLTKPWLAPTRTSVYSRLLPRLLLAPDVALRLEPEQVPLRLRYGPLASADRTRASLQARGTGAVRRSAGRLRLRSRAQSWRTRGERTGSR